jgi:hypothetical protein
VSSGSTAGQRHDTVPASVRDERGVDGPTQSYRYLLRMELARGLGRAGRRPIRTMAVVRPRGEAGTGRYTGGASRSDHLTSVESVPVAAVETTEPLDDDSASHGF